MPMISIPHYESYHGETHIALLDNSTVGFLGALDSEGKETVLLFNEYDLILIPRWVFEEINDSEYRVNYVEKLASVLPVFYIEEKQYSELMDGTEIFLYNIVNASVSRVSQLISYIRKNVTKQNLIDMEAYEVWIEKMYDNWPINGQLKLNGNPRKKNAGEISLTILAEIFSWYYPDTNTITIFSQDSDTYAFQQKAEEELSKTMRDKSRVAVGFKSNDFILCQMYRSSQLSANDVLRLRKDKRILTYVKKRDDEAVVIEKKEIGNERFIDIINDVTIDIIF
jgi:hypothetical protein